MEKTNKKDIDKDVKKKVIYKQVSIQKSELTKKELKTKYKKWQLLFAKMIGVEVADAYQFLFRITYKGSNKLMIGDIVINSEGAIFMVISETNRIAMIVSKDSYVNKPKAYGTLKILSRRTDKNKK